ncbi:hypothetical protein GDO81_010497 [Engystomops pustulosus]|uniref:Uncharacterized protein n=1 Tax=Engystomops pustulosus TaxID=76066 RepID=A0AAV7C0L0_ENGPU|nr:hypothetical protein GDO81_010497 [Engystomops pustulosus]
MPNSAGGTRDTPDSAGGAGDMPDSAGGALDTLDSAGGARDTPDSAGGARGMPDSAGGARDMPDSAGGARDMPDSAGGARDMPDSAGGARDMPGGLQSGRVCNGGATQCSAPYWSYCSTALVISHRQLNVISQTLTNQDLALPLTLQIRALVSVGRNDYFWLALPVPLFCWRLLLLTLSEQTLPIPLCMILPP